MRCRIKNPCFFDIFPDLSKLQSLISYHILLIRYLYISGGILADRRDIYNVAIAYLQEGVGNGNLNKTINFVHIVDGEKIGQLQESGRDQGHSTMVIALLSVIGELTYNQGDDFYGYKDNLILRGSEYNAK